ncbi:MAG TPA: tetratricopeptide repeat protein [Pseudonocardiaceae bacterium]|jgi:Flp pilus assembly protein TadD|nr:tetratricopeptide repeat protein [Pseudonocardiaceae bacterium]
MSDVAASPTDAALRLINVGRPDEAAAVLSVFLTERPDSIVALGLLALACLRAHRWSDALTAADAAIGIDPEYLPAWQRRAIALLELDRPAEAEAAAAEYLRLGPDQWYAHYLMARVLYPVRGRRSEALRHAESARELDPNQADVHNLLGVVHRALERRAEAERAYRTALAIDPTHALARSNLALLQLGRSAGQTMAGLRAAAASDPQQDSIHQNIALVSVLGLVKRAAYLAQADLLLALFTWAAVYGSGDAVRPRLIVLGLIVLGWTVVVGLWWRGLRPYLRSLIPAALRRLLGGSHARWGLGGIAGAVVCAVVAVFWVQPVVEIAGYALLLGGPGLSRTLVVRDRRRAARDLS